MNYSLTNIITQYKTDKESVYNTWFVNESSMKKVISILFCVPCFFACQNKKDHPISCFTVTNPVMDLGDTVIIELCSAKKSSKESEWDMGNTLYRRGAIPKHIYKAKGTYTIKLKSYEHLSGKQLSHWQKGVTSAANNNRSIKT